MRREHPRLFKTSQVDPGNGQQRRCRTISGCKLEARYRLKRLDLVDQGSCHYTKQRGSTLWVAYALEMILTPTEQ